MNFSAFSSQGRGKSGHSNNDDRTSAETGVGTGRGSGRMATRIGRRDGQKQQQTDGG